MSSQDRADGTTEPLAARVVLSFPADIGEHGRSRIRSDYYRTYLTKVHDTAAEGDEWDEFTDVGCCGSRMDVPLVVERVVTEPPRENEVGDDDLAVDSGSRVGLDTEIEYTEREACGVNRGWSVQHDEPEALDD
ncbi:hypothetical protein HZS55_04015 [Halosimplex rubrum]|uniref:DUF7968 domain-containing protein n=1 Tax=Halosimplex rubrum TaxID=869889 RepID=A0A7D5P3E7_9EURY|nr:hypothetical protein [Halosimplex rubrum]QLH76522.1 hypothetical protein HZS55_04015 [Halosimplex rubrum]